MKTKRLVWFGVAVVVIFLLSVNIYWKETGHRTLSNEQQNSPHLQIGSRRIQLEIVDTPLAQARGLGGRESLPKDAGMLFVFPEPDIHPFWMKDMHFPIDILWISKGVIVEVVTLPPPPPGGEIPRHDPAALADMVLELNAGEAQALGLVVGSRVDIHY